MTLSLVGGCGLEPIPGADLSACVTQPCANAGGSGGTSTTTGGAGPGATGGAPSGTGGAGAGGTPTTGGATGSGGINGGGGAPGSGGAGEPCTDVPPPDELHDWAGATCYQWANEAMTDVCSEEWFDGYCDESCGHCTSSGTGGSGSGGGGNDGSGGSLGNDNPWGNVTGGQNGWASRYWDCCKQSCGWANNAGQNPVDSCGGNGENVTGADGQSACSGGPATTCNSFAPWAYSDVVSFGFAATHAGSGAQCGVCYQLQFTGQGQHSASDPGSQAIAGKVMIVMAANIGGDVSADGQLDVLIPGGGIGAATPGSQLGYGCDSAWGISDGEASSVLGAAYGGFRAGCNGDLNSVKSCMSQKCESVFGSRGLDDMYDGCMWYTNWLNAADNPKFTYKQIECPQELVQVSGR